MTNQEIYDLYIAGEATLIESYLVDWCIESDSMRSNASEEAIVEYKGERYIIGFQDKLVDQPEKKAEHPNSVDEAK